MKQRILIISPAPTHPPSGGNNARVLQLFNSLQQLGCEVHLLHIERMSGDPQAMRALFGDNFHRFPYGLQAHPFWYWRRKIARRLGLNAQYVFGIDEWWDSSAEAEILRLQREYEFDGVFAEYAFFSKALTLFDDSVLKVLDTHDRFADRHQLFLDKDTKPRWFSTSTAQEALAFSRAHVVLAIQDHEAALFQTYTDKTVCVVGHAVIVRPPREKKLAKRILYVGTNNPINVSSINWFLHEVFPMIRAVVEDVQVDLVGDVCKEIPDCAGVNKLGKVADLCEAYDTADLVINPMQFGTGLKIKSIEALGYAKPLVATSSGAHGLEEAEGLALYIADEPQTFSSPIIQLLSDDDRLYRSSVAAYEYALQWNEKVNENLLCCLNSK